MGNQVILADAKPQRRSMRRPSHTWNLNFKPFQIQPFCIAPVLPGETLKTGMLQARTVTNPVANPLIGWWHEHYLFYVPFGCMENKDSLREMVLDPEYDASSLYNDGGSYVFYTADDTVDYVTECLNACVLHFFRNEGETTAPLLGGVPLGAIRGNSYLDSFTLDTDISSHDFDVDLDASSSVEASEIEKSMLLYEMSKMQGITNMTYEDWLTTYGIKKQKPDDTCEPELLRQSMDWSYPTNTINPSDGSPSSALSWSKQVRIDKDRFFKEPGFIFGVTITRPKVYFKGDGSAAGHMQNAFSWLPAVLNNDATVGMVKQASSTGCLSTITGDDYWFDIRDLFMYGDQYINFVNTTTGKNIVSNVSSSGVTKYAIEADITALFATAEENTINEDGILTCAIASNVKDLTPSF